MQFALVKGGVVVNVIEADLQFASSLTSDYDHIQDVGPLRQQGVPVGPGWLWDVESGFYQPVIADPGNERPRHISVGAFFDRFAEHKYNILADQTPLVQALIKDVSVRAYIDLDNPTLAQGLALLVGSGYAIDTTAILTAEIIPSERP